MPLFPSEVSHWDCNSSYPCSPCPVCSACALRSCADGVARACRVPVCDISWLADQTPGHNILVNPRDKMFRMEFLAPGVDVSFPKSGAVELVVFRQRCQNRSPWPRINLWGGRRCLILLIPLNYTEKKSIFKEKSQTGLWLLHITGLQITTRSLANASNFISGRQKLQDLIAHLASKKFCQPLLKPNWGLTDLLLSLSFSLFVTDKTFSRVRLFIGSMSYEVPRINNVEIYSEDTM